MSPIKDWLGNVTTDGDMVSVTVGLPDDPVPIEQDYEMVPVDRITTHPDNARRGNMEVIRESIRANGFYGVCVVQRSTGRILIGNHRYRAAIEEGLTEVPIVWVDKSDEEARRLLLVDNRTTDLAVYDDQALVELLSNYADDNGGLVGTGWDDGELAALLAAIEPPRIVVDVDVPPLPVEAVTKVGDLILLGEHRLLCGDTTDPANIARLVDGATLTLVHADPPYGMGKESDGILNDNLYNDRLDKFQMEWWAAWRPSMADNASAYIWGNAPDLWRLWYVGGLSDSERLTFRNEIVWAKGSAGAGGISHMGAEGLRGYPLSTERCLFFMLGVRGFNINADNYWDGWEPIRSALAADCEQMGWGQEDIKRITGVGMFGHWFTTSQWTFIPEEHYLKLQEAARDHDAFKRDYDELKRDYDELKREFYATRAHFDNTHDSMTDVWSFNRVTSDDRHGHATPKPVDAMARVVKSSTNPGDVIGVPFGGTAPEIVAAEQLDRRCVIAEIDPGYCDVIVARWEKLTGQSAQRP